MARALLAGLMLGGLALVAVAKWMRPKKAPPSEAPARPPTGVVIPKPARPPTAMPKAKVVPVRVPARPAVPTAGPAPPSKVSLKPIMIRPPRSPPEEEKKEERPEYVYKVVRLLGQQAVLYVYRGGRPYYGIRKHYTYLLSKLQRAGCSYYAEGRIWKCPTRVF